MARDVIRVLLADDHEIVRLGLRSILDGADDIEVIGEVATAEAAVAAATSGGIDVVLMDLWMPLMDGYEATERILGMHHAKNGGLNGGLNGTSHGPTVLAVTADVTDGALERAARVGMKGFMTKPYKLMDLQRLITEYCARNQTEAGA